MDHINVNVNVQFTVSVVSYRIFLHSWLVANSYREIIQISTQVPHTELNRFYIFFLGCYLLLSLSVSGQIASVSNNSGPWLKNS